MLTNDELEAAIAASPSRNRVTKAYMGRRITETKFHKLGFLTHCTIHLDNGFMVTGESACVEPANYDLEIGEKIAYDNAYAKLWPLFGFLLAERIWDRKLAVQIQEANSKDGTEMQEPTEG